MNTEYRLNGSLCINKHTHIHNVAVVNSNSIVVSRYYYIQKCYCSTRISSRGAHYVEYKNIYVYHI